MYQYEDIVTDGTMLCRFLLFQKLDNRMLFLKCLRFPDVCDIASQCREAGLVYVSAVGNKNKKLALVEFICAALIEYICASRYSVKLHTNLHEHSITFSGWPEFV